MNEKLFKELEKLSISEIIEAANQCTCSHEFLIRNKKKCEVFFEAVRDYCVDRYENQDG